MPRIDLIQIRADTAANWASANPTLESAELGIETDMRRVKFGDGSTAYNSLNYAWLPEMVMTATKTGTYTAALEEIVLADPSGGGFTVNLPTAVSKKHRRITVKNITSSTNTITLDGNSSETIDGATTLAMSTAWQCVRIISDGANWLTI